MALCKCAPWTEKQIQSAVTQLILKIQCLKSLPSSPNRVKPQGELLQVTCLLAFTHYFGNPAAELPPWCWYCWSIQWEGCGSCLCSLLCVLWPSCVGHILPFLHYALCPWLPWLEPVHFLVAHLFSRSFICATAMFGFECGAGSK